jgi:hypothetical protein
MSFNFELIHLIIYLGFFVLGLILAIIGTLIFRTGQSASSKTGLGLDSPIEAITGIGKKIGKELRSAGVTTVDDFLRADPKKLDGKTDRITEERIIELQTETKNKIGGGK